MSAEAASMLGTESTSTSEHSQFENIINSFEGALSFVRKRRTELLLTGVTMLGGIAYNAADADAAPADVYASASAMAYKKDLSLFSPSSRNSSRVISREILA